MEGFLHRKSSMIQEPVQRIIIGVAGGSAAGKTTLCQNINRQMAFDRNFKVEMVSLDSFYKSLDTTVISAADYNFDHPNALDFDLAYETLKLMKYSNQKVPIPQYSFIQHKRLPDPTYVSPANIILFEGLMAFHDPRIRDLMTYKVFITCDDDIRLCRRIKRDTRERGRSIESVLLQYNRFVKDSFRNFIAPTMVYADIIIPGFRNNRVSVDFIVQHIKNIARKINFRQTAARTKIYIFGQNQLYDFEYRQSSTRDFFGDSFLVFPTSQEHKKQLEFFMNRLVSQTFSYEYYEEIYLHQFIKIQKSLLKQLIQLKEFKTNNIEIFTEHNIPEINKYQLYQKQVKVIFYPVAYTVQAEKLVSMMKKQSKKNTVFIVLTIFCDMNFPRAIYKIGINNVILINLFLIANERRFREAMENNIGLTQNKANWIQNDHILANQGAYIIAESLKLSFISQLALEQKRYDTAIRQLKKPLIRRTINESQQIVLPFHQKLTYSQQHENLCGYHTLVNIILLNKKNPLTQKLNFIKYYSSLSKSINSLNFQPLQRNQVDILLNDNYFAGLHIGVFYYSMNYIQNTVEELNEIQKLFKQLSLGMINVVYLIMGVFDHFFLLQITNEYLESKDNKREQIINFYDSSNISLTDVMNDTDNQYKKQHTEIDEIELEQHKKHKKNLKQSLEIVAQVSRGQKSFKQILVQKRIQQIAVPFLQLKDQKQMQKFFKSEYPIPVIVNDLLKPLKFVSEKTLSQKHQKILSQWRSHPAIKWGILASLNQ